MRNMGTDRMTSEAQVEDSHKKLLLMLRRAREREFRAFLRFIVTRSQDNKWRLVFGRIDLAREGVPVVDADDLEGRLRILSEEVSIDRLRDRLGRAFTGRPFVCDRTRIEDHGLDARWHDHGRARRQDWCCTWPIERMSVTARERPEFPDDHLQGRSSAYDGVHDVLKRATGLANYQVGADGRVFQTHVLLWDYRGRIDAADFDGDKLIYEVSPPNSSELTLLVTAKGGKAAPPITQPAKGEVVLSDAGGGARVTLKCGSAMLEDRHVEVAVDGPSPVPRGRLPRLREPRFTVFYAWQSDTGADQNRKFIEKAALAAIARLREDVVLDEDPRLDHDTLGVPGSPAIADTIFAKIDRASVFLWDATIVSPPDAVRPTPNPNVLIELGYAAAKLEWGRIVGVMNDAYGSFEKLPFDLKYRRAPLAYTIDQNTDEKRRKKIASRLSKAIENALRTILRTKPSEDAAPLVTEEFEIV